MEYYKLSTKECFEIFQSNPSGLSKSEVAEKIAEYGKNEIAVKGKPIWKKIIEPFANILMVVLLFAALLSLLQGEVTDATIIASIMGINAIIYYIQQFSTDRVLKSLQKKNNLVVDVLRDGKPVQIDSADIVPGDVIMLEEGDKIPADCRIIETDSLRVDESQMTGESMPIGKQTEPISGKKEVFEQLNMLFCGSFVVGGQAKALVVATGNDSEYGKLASISVSSGEASPVQKKISKLISRLIKIVSIVAIVAFALAIYRGMNLNDSIRYVLALSVSAVPEGLAVAITVVLVFGMRRMAKKKALVKSQAAIETVGIITFIASDKTGTLTRNKLTLQHTWELNESGVINQSIACSTLPAISKNRDPLDVAMEDFLHNKLSQHVQDTIPFDQEFAMSGNIINQDGNLILYVKGSPEKVIERSKLSKADHALIHNEILSMAANGLRVLALGRLPLGSKIDSFSELPSHSEFQFDGLIGVADVLRPEANGAIKRARAAGIKVCMVTGDHFETAFNIGKQLGIVSQRDEVFDCTKMHDVSDNELSSLLSTIRVFARVTPENKHRLLSILKINEITAMTGDGVNDVPALTGAHVGFAMGSGTSIAKDAGDIILLDDNFKSIVDAIHEGRTIYANIKRMVAYLLSTNAGEVSVSLGALIIGVPIPIIAVQILWINLVTDTCMVIPLGLEPGEKRNMQHPPQKSNAPLFSRFMLSRIALTILTMATISLSLYMYFLDKNGVDYARTVVFNALVVMQWASAFNYRSDYESILIRIKRISWPFILGLSVAITTQAIAILGFLHGPLNIKATPSTYDLVTTSTLAFLLPIIIIEFHKWVGRTFFNKGNKVI